MARERKKLTLGKGAAFVKGRLKRLLQGKDTWEADFRALPSPLSQIALSESPGPLVKTHRTAVAVVPPRGVWGTIQAIRERHDRQVRCWPPPVNLLSWGTPRRRPRRPTSTCCRLCRSRPPRR